MKGAAGRLIVLAVIGGLLLVVPSQSDAEEPTWWERCEELPSEQVEACFHEHNGETERGERPPTPPAAPIRKWISERFPGARSIFINCPGNNRLGDNGRACEFRLIDRQRVIKGFAALEAENETWSHTAWWLMHFHAQAPSPQRWRRCGLPKGRDFPESVRLSARGTACHQAEELALRIGYMDVSPYTLRLPHRFAEGEWQTNTLGFVVERYRCRGLVQVRQGYPNPYGHETAVCRTRFGDRVTFVFNKGS